MQKRAFWMLFVLVALSVVLCAFGTAVPADAASVDVKSFSYTDGLGRIITHDFSSGSISGTTQITLPPAAVQNIPESESGMTWYWMVPPGMEPSSSIGLNTSSAFSRLTQTSSGANSDDAVVVLTTQNPVAGSSSTATFRATLTNFTAPPSQGTFVEAYAGFGSPDEQYPSPSIQIQWITGYFRGVKYTNALMAKAFYTDPDTDDDILVRDWTLIQNNLNPATTIIELIVSIQDDGTFTASYKLNGGGEVLFSTSTGAAGRFQSYQALYPYVSLNAGDTMAGHAMSVHYFTGQYYANLWANDETHDATGVSVSGPGISGNSSLVWNADINNWILMSNPPFLGTTQPATSQTYTFAFTLPDASSLVSTSTITGYVNVFASNLLPTGTVTAGQPVNFSWTGAAGADEYQVMLYNSSNQTIWTQWGIEGTSFQYNGPPLANGLYTYEIWSGVPTGNERNYSVQRGQFIYGSGTVYTLSVSKNGTGSGTVDGSTGGPNPIGCGSVCSALLAPGITVQLTATPAAGSTFAGWSGGVCSGTAPCSVTMNSAKSVTATFNTAACSAPAAPTVNDPGVSAASGASYNVTWSTVAGATSYDICEATNPSFAGQTCTNVAGTTKAYSHTVSGTSTYYYRALARNACGPGAYSAGTRDMMVYNLASIEPDVYAEVICPASGAVNEAVNVGIKIHNKTCGVPLTFTKLNATLLGNAAGTLSGLGIYGPQRSTINLTAPAPVCPAEGVSNQITLAVGYPINAALSGKSAQIMIEAMTADDRAVAGGACMVPIQ